MGKKNGFRSSMIADAQKASTAMQTSTIAKQLKANGFTAATMAAEASALTDLDATAEAARSAWLQASAALQTKAQSFDDVGRVTATSSGASRRTGRSGRRTGFLAPA